MLLRRIIFENYGLYAGRVEIDLLPRVKHGQERPIVLIGGKNGTGKTTLLDAIRLVLYGKSVLGDRVSQKDYEDFLRHQIHRNSTAILACDFARIAIEFDYVTAGTQKTYLVERSWKVGQKNGVKEFLQIKENGKELEQINGDFWQGFVEDILPERLSQLFFFDGEKIKSIAADDNGSQVLADAIKTLLGLDMVDLLKADLSIYMAREFKKNGAKADKHVLKNLEAKIGKTKQAIARKLDELAGIRTSIDGVLADIKNKEERLRQEGHFYATKRDELSNQKVQFAGQIEALEHQIRAECEKTFPFALCPTVACMLRTQIAEEKERKRISLVRDELVSIQDDLLNESRKIDKSTRRKVEGIIKTTFLARLEKIKQHSGMVEIHGLSDASAAQILGWLDEAENQSKPAVNKAGRLLAELQRNLQGTVKELAKCPEEAQTRPLFDALSLLNQRLGEFQQQEKQLNIQISQNEHELAGIQREERRHIASQLEEDTAGRRLWLARGIQEALDAYKNRLITQKIDQLRQAVVQGFNQLSSKGDLISEVVIDPQTFATVLYDNNNKAIKMKTLSAGEKQLFAVAVLWGLAKTSGRPLPVIVDTPLGRLDSDHRRNLIENYFPRASHQVILLSTDTEVDQQLFKRLSPDISHCYHLHYDKEAQSTKPREEYFWKKTINA